MARPTPRPSASSTLRVPGMRRTMAVALRRVRVPVDRDRRLGRAILREVHALARAYGWREREILGAGRRDADDSTSSWWAMTRIPRNASSRRLGPAHPPSGRASPRGSSADAAPCARPPVRYVGGRRRVARPARAGRSRAIERRAVGGRRAIGARSAPRRRAGHRRAAAPRARRHGFPSLPPLGRPHSREADPVHSARTPRAGSARPGPGLTSTRRDSHETTRADAERSACRPAAAPETAAGRTVRGAAGVEPRAIDGRRSTGPSTPATPSLRGQRAATPSRESRRWATPLDAPGRPRAGQRSSAPRAGARARPSASRSRAGPTTPGPSVSTRRAAEPPRRRAPAPPTIERDDRADRGASRAGAGARRRDRRVRPRP